MLKLYNTLSRKKEDFKPLKDKKVNLFVCGPTVYDFPHIGHARTYVIFDVIVKYLRQKGYKVFYLQNITDVDDKIINRAKEKNLSPKELAQNFEKEYLKDMESLKINSVNKYARATEHIKEIISQVERLLKKGYAYHLEDGIYYNISKFKEYGKLSKRTVLQAEDGISRIDEGLNKRNKGDFCLWKFSRPEEPKWQSPWGLGRPGWHIEDTAITEKYFGPQYDVHGGGKDLIFPHHEAEISQMEAISGKKPLVKYWIHTGFLTVSGQKMSKSLGNFITIRDFLKENSVRLTRFFIVKNLYRSPIDYSEKSIIQAKKELERIDEFIEKLKEQKSKKKKGQMEKLVLSTEKKFEETMEEDFNTPKAIALIFDLINKGNSLISKNELCASEAKKTLNFFKKIDKFFDFIFWQKSKEKIPSDVLELTKQRESYRKTGLWQKADEIRKEIEKMGYQIEDTKHGPKIKKI
jgi:cysteinyl-tRNA synthetase